MLNEIFTEFDEALLQYGVEKIKTIGDAYMVVSGLIPRPDHAVCCLEFGIHMINTLTLYNHRHNSNIGIRVGINTGRVVAGVIGSKKFTYDVWGDAVNVASTAPRMCVQVSQSTHALLCNLYSFDKRNGILIKGKGVMDAYVLKKDYLDVYDDQEEEELMRL
ncbi:adenylate cyclase [Acrasis kona]|uniref:Adenylate cyclase n=1 Tax=Acrasis kona TaxID=1008807 RepID=A0AAW2ZRC6_9EUKA